MYSETTLWQQRVLMSTLSKKKKQLENWLLGNVPELSLSFFLVLTISWGNVIISKVIFCPNFWRSHYILFSWEPALWSLYSQERVGGGGGKKKGVAIFTYKHLTFEPRHENKTCRPCPKDQHYAFAIWHISYDIMTAWQTIAFETTQENKSCSACPKDQH